MLLAVFLHSVYEFTHVLMLSDCVEESKVNHLQLHEVKLGDSAEFLRVLQLLLEIFRRTNGRLICQVYSQA